MNLIGRCDLAFHADNPFKTADELLKSGEKRRSRCLTSTPRRRAKSSPWLLPRWPRQRIWGTHTHVPTADEEVFPKGTGYLTDLGMTGAVRSVLGIKPEQSVETFLGGLPGRYREPEKSAGKMQGAIFTLDDATGSAWASSA